MREHEEKQTFKDAPGAEVARGGGVEADRAQLAHTRSVATQLRARGAPGPGSVQRAAAAGVRGSGQTLPHLQRIQQAFGHHDVTAVQAHVGGAAREAAEAIGAEAYATGNAVAFRSAPDLHTAAHEAAHIVQQRVGVQLKGGVGQVGDPYERHADAVADRVVQGKSAVDLLDGFAGGGGEAAVQRKEQPPACGGEAGMANKPASFNVPARPPARAWFKAEALRREVDTPVHVARETAEGEAMIRGAMNLVSLNGAVTGALSRVAALGFDFLNAGMTTRAEQGAEMLQRKWELYVHCLGGYGYTLDQQYNIHDRAGRVVDTWWKDNIK
ncbi:MAG: DUF4157 domain-containing protein [Myxococcales bacterium]|nr:DUF4157 domain-containing protein [Myxococcales bacterium]